MKLSEAKPCALCRGPLREAQVIHWYVLRVSMALMKPQATNTVMGLSQIFGGSLALAEAFAPEEPIVIAGDAKPGELPWTELHVCFKCWTGPLGQLAAAVEAYPELCAGA